MSADGSDAADIYVTRVALATVEPGEFGDTPERGLYVIVYLKAIGTGAAFPVNPFDFYLVGTDGEHYEDQTFSSAWGAPFESATLHQGERATGTITFDVNPKAGHGRIGYSPNSDGDPIAVWRY